MVRKSSSHTLFRLLYVSASLLPPDSADRIVEGIVDVARARNSREGITGALLFTGEGFAQVLEGEQQAVLRLMADIERDRGHHEINIVLQAAVATRWFDGWSMAYNGTATYVKDLVDALRKPAAGISDASTDVELLSQFLRRSVSPRL